MAARVWWLLSPASHFHLARWLRWRPTMDKTALMAIAWSRQRHQQQVQLGTKSGLWMPARVSS